MDFEELTAALQRAKDAEERTGTRMFLGTPDRWFEAGLWRCVEGHVSTWYVKSEERGSSCPACGEPVRLTFPEDEDGELQLPEGA